MTMYTYIMVRTQIYLTEAETSALDRKARESGRTRSQLIRVAIDQTYLSPVDDAKILRALELSSGAWKRKESGADCVERLRTGRRLAKLRGRRTA